jgi:hypothetical protein
MLFAHLKRIFWGLDGFCCAAHAMLKMSSLAALAQNLRRLAKLVARPPPAASHCLA